jgi:16S rRNA (uracil1498-N3)-methyltransferase
MPFGSAVTHATGRRYLLWEDVGGEPSLGLGQAVAADALAGSNEETSLLIGPEGGFANDEVTAAGDAGWQLTTLGPRILRAETAALAAVTILMDRLDEFAR